MPARCLMIVNGPLVITHAHAAPLLLPPMQRITTKHTKAQILEAYSALEAQAQQGPTWDQIIAKAVTTGQTVAIETVALIRDCYNAGAQLRQWVSHVSDELRRPVLRSDVLS